SRNNTAPGCGSLNTVATEHVRAERSGSSARPDLVETDLEARLANCGVAPRCARFARRSHAGGDWTARKLEDRAEEIVDAYLRAGVDQGDWRALDALVNRVYGKPK